VSAWAAADRTALIGTYARRREGRQWFVTTNDAQLPRSDPLTARRTVGASVEDGPAGVLDYHRLVTGVDMAIAPLLEGD
jgi:hypothetical protein